jgi:hypothetical protein
VSSASPIPLTDPGPDGMSDRCIHLVLKTDPKRARRLNDQSGMINPAWPSVMRITPLNLPEPHRD